MPLAEANDDPHLAPRTSEVEKVYRTQAGGLSATISAAPGTVRSRIGF
jgi:hypothetical protein